MKGAWPLWDAASTVATDLPRFVRDQPVPPDQDLMLQILQETNGHLAARRPLPRPKAFDKGIP